MNKKSADDYKIANLDALELKEQLGFKPVIETGESAANSRLF
jgi:hypothetical protein